MTIALAYTALSGPLAPDSMPGTIAFAAVTAGAALLPDLDHPSGSAAISWGPLSKMLSRLVVVAFGPHRHGAHSVFTALGLGLVAGIAGGLGGLWPVVMVFFAVSLAMGVLWRSRGLGNEFMGASAATAVYFGQIETQWLGLAIGIGCLAHIAGDKLTPQSMALWWPISPEMRPGLGLFTTQSPMTAGETALLWSCRATNAALIVLLSGYWSSATGMAQDSWPYLAETTRIITGIK